MKYFRSFFGAWLSAVAAFSHVPAMADSSPPVLVIDDTRYAGAWSDDRQVAAYLGVPFAAPPVEELRWQPPMPAVTPAGLVDATEYAPACYQGQHLVNWYRNVITSFGGDPGVMLGPEFSEDCLYLNVSAPRSWSTSSGPSIFCGKFCASWPRAESFSSACPTPRSTAAASAPAEK